jgi:methionine aminopeptidase
MAKEYEPIKLSPEDIEKLRSLQSIIDHARFELQRARKVGIDVDELEDMLEKAVQLRDRLLETYAEEK